MKLICKTRLFPAEPAFVGTRVSVLTTEESRTWGFKTATLAEGSGRIRVAWGDGAVEEFAQDMNQVTHAYSEPGRHEVEISDDVAAFGISALTGVFQTTYMPMVCGVRSNARKLAALAEIAFSRGTHLEELDLRETGIRTIPRYCFRQCAALSGLEGLPRGVEEIGTTAFSGCSRIEVVRFPHVVSVKGGASSLPFAGCTALREIHFAAAHRDALLASPAFQVDPEHLGAAGATVAFDL